MLTLRTLKELIDTPKRGEKLPTPKQLRTGESPVVAHKTTGAGVNEVHIIVYQSGYAVYGIGNRATVFPVNLELGYGYSSVTEKKRKEDEKYNTWNPETGLREKKYFCELEESFFEKEEWYLRLMLIGEDRLAHNLATRDRGRCISFNGISEDFEGMEDELMDVEERVNRQQIAEEMMSVLSDKQKKVVQEFYWNQKTHKQIAKENGVKRNAVTEILEKEIAPLEIGSWTKPEGGYFISFDSLPGCAKRIVALCKDAGVTLTGAGATYPYGKDPEDKNIRIAPTYPSVDELKKAMEIFCLAVKIASAEKVL